MTPPLASLAAFGTGVLAGACTGTLHTRFKINPLLSSILVMTALYSVNLHVMGSSNLSLLGVNSLATQAERIGARECSATMASGIGSSQATCCSWLRESNQIEEISENFVMWRVFDGPHGGEVSA